MFAGKNKTVALTALTIAGICGGAQAGTITGKFTYDLKSTVDITASGGIYNGNVNTVAFHWKRTDHSGAGVDSSVPITFDTYCVDLKQSVSASQSYTFNVIPLANAGYSQTKMDLLRTLWTLNKPAVNTSTVAAAFQVAIWEIIYDTNNNVTTGTFKLNSPTSVRNVATNMLNTAVAMRGKAPMANLVVLRSDCAQDQLCELPPSIPTPGTATLAAAGVLMAVRRKRKQA